MQLIDLLEAIPDEAFGGTAATECTLLNKFGDTFPTKDFGARFMELAFVQVALRALESFLLSDRELLLMTRFPSTYLGKEDQHIRNRLRELLGCDAPVQLVAYLKKCLTSGSALRGERTPISAITLNDMFVRAHESHLRHELRCTICGYHFRESDLLSEDKREAARSCGLQFAEVTHAKRKVDSLKPIELMSSAGRTISLTSMEIDHLVPELGLGWTESDNLQFVCTYCNRGKLIFRRPLEAISTAVAGALADIPETRPSARSRQVVVVSAIRQAGGKCSVCRAGVQDVELTANLKNADCDARRWLVPWNVLVVCYRCKQDA